MCGHDCRYAATPQQQWANHRVVVDHIDTELIEILTGGKGMHDLRDRLTEAFCKGLRVGGKEAGVSAALPDPH
jgi:hypothetical protein